MNIIADLQLHSKYSQAVSKKMDLYEIASWASKKGIHLVATGDWQHPVWFTEIETHLKEVSDGIFTLKEKPDTQKHDVYFLLSSEISCIYTHYGKGRRVHNLIWSPSLGVSRKIIKRLEAYGANIRSDGRPIIGMSSKNLLQLILDVDPRCMLIPAHVWTPWFGLYGSKSGYDSIDECFEDMADHIYAVETGLSSDPLMNWQIKELENRSIVSFSDAHSGPKLGREATVFETTEGNERLTMKELTFDDVAAAIKSDIRGRLKIAHTIEFFPEEGKYHWDGHRNCNVKLSPEETYKNGSTCPVCKRPLTIGVGHRIMDLADAQRNVTDMTVTIRDTADLAFVFDKEKKRTPFVSVVPLLEILREITKSKTKSERQYEALVSHFSTEFDILLTQPYEEIRKHAGPELAQAIKLVRQRKLDINPGYDGVYGTVHLFRDQKTLL